MKYKSRTEGGAEELVRRPTTHNADAVETSSAECTFREDRPQPGPAVLPSTLPTPHSSLVSVFDVQKRQNLDPTLPGIGVWW